jgi:hypothetical protein
VIAVEVWAQEPADLGVSLLVGLEHGLLSVALERYAAVSADLRRSGAKVAVEVVPSIVGAEVAEDAEHSATITTQATKRRLRRCVNADAR